MTHFEEYNKIIEFRKSNPLPNDQYGEAHHIVPKSICPLLKNAKSNIVGLSAQEHFLAHYHLWKTFRDELREKKWARKMCSAFVMMKKQLMKSNDIEALSRLYEEVRTDFSKILRGRKNPNAVAAMRKARLGSHNTKEANEANRIAHLGNNHWLGKHHTEATRKKLSLSHKGKPSHSQTQDSRHKISKARIGKKWYTNGISEICSKDCPEGFVRGRLKRQHK